MPKKTGLEIINFDLTDELNKKVDGLPGGQAIKNSPLYSDALAAAQTGDNTGTNQKIEMIVLTMELPKTVLDELKV